MFERKKYKSFALKQLKGRWKVPVLITLVTILIGLLFSIPDGSFRMKVGSLGRFFASFDVSELEGLNTASQSPFMASIFSLIAAIISATFTFAMIKVLIVMTRSPEPVSFQLFIEGLTDWKRAVLTNLYYTFKILLWFLLPALFIICMSTVTFLAFSFLDSTALGIVLLILFFGLFVFTYVILIMKMFAYSQIIYFAAEFSNIKIRDALRLSIVITKGHKWSLFVLGLSFLGWGILALLTLGIGFIWLQPYMTMTELNAFHAMLQEAIENGKVKPEELA